MTSVLVVKHAEAPLQTTMHLAEEQQAPRDLQHFRFNGKYRVLQGAANMLCRELNVCKEGDDGGTSNLRRWRDAQDTRITCRRRS